MANIIDINTKYLLGLESDLTHDELLRMCLTEEQYRRAFTNLTVSFTVCLKGFPPSMVDKEIYEFLASKGYRRASRVLFSAFTFYNTPEGHDYWLRVCDVADQIQFNHLN